MNDLRRNACHRRRASVLVGALTAVALLGSKQVMGQNPQQQRTVPADPASVYPQAVESPVRMTPQEIQRYQHAKTLIDWTPEQIRDHPDLQGLQPAESPQRGLPGILRAVGERVSKLFEDFPNLTSMEEVRSGPCDEGLRKKCRATYRGKFNYLVIRRTEGDPLMGEYRTDLKGRPIDYRRLGRGRIFLTYGFTTTPLQHFHPQNQTACRFRYFGRQEVAGQETEVVGFAEIPGKYPWPTELGHGNTVVPLLLQGLAWIDPATYQIARIETFLVAPPPDGDLESETTQVEFSQIQLHQARTTLWLPTEVVVDVWVHHRHFRNVHRYSAFRLFEVETRIRPVEEK